jgi:type IV secretory pathway VirD2 relaxase
MVARIIIGRSIRGVLNYNENKVNERVAEYIRAENFYGEGHELKFYEKLNRFTTSLEKNNVARTNTMHISLNFDLKEKLDKDKLSEIASVYMDKIGFGDQPYLVYQHTDAAHPHVHIVTTNIRDDGSRIDTHNIAKIKSEPARKKR